MHCEQCLPLIEVTLPLLFFWASSHFSCPIDTGDHFLFLSFNSISLWLWKPVSSALWSGLLSLFLTPKHQSSLELVSLVQISFLSSTTVFPAVCWLFYLANSDASDTLVPTWTCGLALPLSLIYRLYLGVPLTFICQSTVTLLPFPFTDAPDDLLLPVALSTMLTASYPATESCFTTDFHMSVQFLFLSQLLLMASSFLLSYLSCSSLLIQREWSPFPAHCSCLLWVFCVTLPI